jgi:hypothetical protein
MSFFIPFAQLSLIDRMGYDRVLCFSCKFGQHLVKVEGVWARRTLASPRADTLFGSLAEADLFNSRASILSWKKIQSLVQRSNGVIQDDLQKKTRPRYPQTARVVRMALQTTETSCKYCLGVETDGSPFYPFFPVERPFGAYAKRNDG